MIYALEVVRALAADEATRGLAVDAVSFQDEESRFVGCLGSRSLTGALTPEYTHQRSMLEAVRQVVKEELSGVGGRRGLTTGSTATSRKRAAR